MFNSLLENDWNNNIYQSFDLNIFTFLRFNLSFKKKAFFVFSSTDTYFTHTVAYKTKLVGYLDREQWLRKIF